MAARFITVLNGVVTGVHHGVISALFADPLMNTHERLPVGDGAEVRPLDRVDFYSASAQKTSIQNQWPMCRADQWDHAHPLGDLDAIRGRQRRTPQLRKGLEGRGAAAQAAEPPQSPVFGAAENAPT